MINGRYTCGYNSRWGGHWVWCNEVYSSKNTKTLLVPSVRNANLAQEGYIFEVMVEADLKFVLFCFFCIFPSDGSDNKEAAASCLCLALVSRQMPSRPFLLHPLTQLCSFFTLIQSQLCLRQLMFYQHSSFNLSLSLLFFFVFPESKTLETLIPVASGQLGSQDHSIFK